VRAGTVLALVVARSRNAVALGDDLARTLGARMGRTRVLDTVSVMLLAGAATAAVGTIGFVGLMVPHVVRWIVGPDQRFKSVRGGDNKFDRRNIVAAIDDSLQRLRTDYIDLYQLHWPERTVNAFGRLMYQHHPEQTFTPFAEVLGVLGEAVKAGKIRHVGLSNETAWGTMRWLAAAEQGAGPRMVSIQNCYHLMNRMFEGGLAEVAIREQIGLLAFSPLAMGTLSGKYLGGARPDGARMTVFPNFPRYMAPRAQEATAAYVGLARKHGLDPAQMALAWINTRDFTTANIIGATSLEQLKSNIASIDLKLSPELVREIEELHKVWTIPVP
jgi:aryl-alcohol dehydrogenase-like predicted oxidoreductase